MISQLHLSGPRPDAPDTRQMHVLLMVGNWGMIAGLLLTLASVIASYPLAASLSLAAQVVAHISTLLFATLVKFGYILRSVALNRLSGCGRHPDEPRRD